MRPFPCLILSVLPALPAFAEDMPTGRWDCTWRTAPFGTLTLRRGAYHFASKHATTASGEGGLGWSDGPIALDGGPLPEAGITSGLVYVAQDQAAAEVAVDLYNPLGVAVTCRAAR